ncbi:exodeoxyribonuclease VII small subunit [Motilimonas pumila]|uniref:Exodeoxyribonuclease 7 small subunit n=1 Tax=Motilimonas pumila TaxID=2303987 RepID=A0A418YKN5_9GAMM|nr:exodeoxyribonuclease VII small subunit [Motilimonas pumila]RJG51541.1 exodeoxyribonuclease VII small subunit [Motilimonas pumila]
MAIKKPENMNFEDSLAELEQIVKHLEQGDIALEDALKQFERGIALARSSAGKLQQAEQQVQILTQMDKDAELDPWQGDA